MYSFKLIKSKLLMRLQIKKQKEIESLQQSPLKLGDHQQMIFSIN